jgi:hypothetical protein
MPLYSIHCFKFLVVVSHYILRANLLTHFMFLLTCLYQGFNILKTEQYFELPTRTFN